VAAAWPCLLIVGAWNLARVSPTEVCCGSRPWLYSCCGVGLFGGLRTFVIAMPSPQ
jgi:hypothetical protein